ncbi:helix-turn-helix domain-containing protein [Amycolatopsis sp. 195334CR]|uniref:helix-turn-helix domain-containing protein n=1 Tax=Amycolatopsis sp. 195334CR TaxID=2814588 RepID=UPI001A8F159B|nr:helix-turn-helix domain-containing protein [Amycolatopsis sp. 195334CR]MBN6038418.1 AraC family transcriptional regulator [Amycolatopsis sp. 195334CR]
MSLEVAGGVEQRPSESPYVERVYRAGDVAGAVPARMRSVANSNWELVVWRDRGETHVAVRGPETGPTVLELGRGESETVGIIFRHGAFLSPLPVPKLVDTAVSSPHTTARSFVLQGEEWETPAYDNAEVFVDRLVRAGLLVRDPLVTDVLRGDATTLVTPRSVQRRVAAATGLTQGAIRQIERARQAVLLLGRGMAAVEVAQRVGYHDQPHLARSLTRFTGRTASQLRQADGDEVLSLLYKTEVAVRP